MQCPSCHKEVPVEDKDIGALYTCPQCRSVYFMGFDGVPEYGEVVQPTPEELAALISIDPVVQSPPTQPQSAIEPNVEPEIEAPIEAPIEASIESVNYQPIEQFNESQVEHFTEQSVEQQVEQPAEQLTTYPDESQSDFMMGSPTNELTAGTTNSFSEPAPSLESSPQQFDAVAEEIMRFGNQQVEVSGLSYDLEIRGIDSKEAMSLLKEAIDDSKFGWIVEDYVQQIKTGTCRFTNLTPVQAFVLVKRIQFIDVEMKWTQNVLT